MEKRRFGKALLPAICLFLISQVGCTGSGTGGAERDDFYNVLMQDGADPWVYKHTDGYYYFTKTTGGDVTVWKSASLTGVDAAPRRVIPTGGHGIWAPELHYIEGAWYIYYAMDDGDNVNHRMYVMENTSADPTEGVWKQKGQITDSTNRWAIDGTVLQLDGQLYFIWSGWEGDVNVSQNLYIAHMSNPWTIDSERVEIARPTYDWETNHSPYVNEGPQVAIRNGTINLVYSASGSWTNDYCLGLITAEVGSDLLNPDSWHKRDEPIFVSGNGLYGPGHHSFTTSPDGTEDWIVYHVAKYKDAGWNREVRAQSFTWNEDNTPNLGVPVDPNVPLSLPSGEVGRTRYEADSHAEYSVQAAAGEYILFVRAANGSLDGEVAYVELSVNRGSPVSLAVLPKGWGNWGLATARIQLKDGVNKLRFTKDRGEFELDSFDIMPLMIPES
ncbi:MAG: family 43 glycosylhydrolase [Paenibacillaceae bacterium]|uniref:Family 43 glycosylhydrolase n=1 Tax=Paenibacillus mellifer TaxID=2937794 RepID=A0A9X1XW64_9BACL|nr:family 43 glycosylhydrolase [Paenibacillus mellifer]MBW4841201.1 family 43 glycosylhydrolase [Paenibacillaceae bacterium]MCK8487135.1 family 43 glycosylhydrolase [Paenibacillus mellifer]